MSSQAWLWLTTVIMTLGGLGILLVGKRRTPTEELQTVLHGIVPIIAACSYFAMAVGQGAVTLPILPGAAAASVGDTRIFYFARYIDWFFTTPLLLVSLAISAMHAGPKRSGAITGIVLADVMMIVTALFFGWSEIPEFKWIWFAISCVAFLGVYYVIWVSLMEANKLERDDVQTHYRRSALFLSVVWFIYPFVLLVSPDGLYAIGDTAAIVGILVIDTLAKVVYGFMAVAADGRITERDLASRTTTTSTTRVAA
ncbi:bacteriorhodopsin [Lichenicola sp.]|uniref:bacteriorhodopsin n=1 Tax=Lichenicola sp. TaxID=2804529 RepID=UPI003B007EDF